MEKEINELKNIIKEYEDITDGLRQENKKLERKVYNLTQFLGWLVHEIEREINK